MPTLCRSCDAISEEPHRICKACGSRRLISHPELFTLTIAHIDCDAFYASVEKRDHPDLASRPLIIGGAHRGVVSTACYIARLSGVRSAMPMFKALKLCPDAVVMRPEMAKYVHESRRIRALMADMTPLVQPLSIDEAALDLAGTEALHRAPPAVMLARLARRVEAEIGVTISIGLSHNRLLAKLAAERDKPRGFSVIGAEAAQLLANEPVSLLPGIGPAATTRLTGIGFTRLAQLQALDVATAYRLLGPDGPALCRRARGEDDRRVEPVRETKSISAETTFDTDIRTLPELERILWQIAEKLARRLRREEFAAGGITLKLKTSEHKLRTRSLRLAVPTALPDLLYAAGRSLLAREIDGTAFRLLGLGAQPLRAVQDADPVDLADPDSERRVARQQALNRLRDKFGTGIIGRGRGFTP
ncbi:DNA polymerase IV [Acidisoma cellulosilytica]|uniref:DNA polymerase IV n=1 Tax=Acidisoma cellulosilyticum TaxID=2802395 RepID=A0A964E3Y5_9PROT|nr:DNA polymerase IV [Acidisoma cellulosilyticum]MCB8880919.1 DNA polymerase IV [Acidisoma cellulosilyticum]